MDIDDFDPGRSTITGQALTARGTDESVARGVAILDAIRQADVAGVTFAGLVDVHHWYLIRYQSGVEQYVSETDPRWMHRLTRWTTNAVPNDAVTRPGALAVAS